MRAIILKIAFIMIILFATNFAFAQEDADGCKDHPFFNRFPKYLIYDCIENFNEYDFMLGKDNPKTLQGTITNIIYSFDGEFGPNLPSKLQIIKNYENAISKMGGTKVYSRTTDDGEWTGATFKFAKDGNDYLLGIYNLINNPVDQYNFVLLKKEGMKQELEAGEMFDKLSSGNVLTLYINFETGKTIIKNESETIIDELYKMLNSNSTLNIEIEGHTDNVGNKSSNQILSEQRAASVKAALVKKGISASRIKTTGYGQDKPTTENNTEEGKSKNRRVEIRKI